MNKEEIIKHTQLKISNILKDCDDRSSQQQTLKMLVMAFIKAGKETNISNQIIEIIIDLVDKEFPHLKKDLDKLLLLL
jgi:hypothetical protein